ncbi:MAG: hypothetical protein RJA22_457 [Verrucomicrobiota bacterium]|jgi:O-antigen/teichoic acid export membrane protein
MSDSTSRRDFFRQSGWMTVAVMAGGVFNTGSNILAQRVLGEQFNEFSTALSALGLLVIPALGLQASFASQAAVADTEEARRQLASTARGALGLMGVIWLGVAGWWLARHEAMREVYQLTHPLSLWLVLFVCLAALLTPVPMGVLQGRQDFLWYGWATLLNGLGRFLVLCVVAVKVKAGTVDALAGVLAGGLVVLGLVLWRAREAWLGPGGVFSWGSWLRRLVPATVALGALTVIMQRDAIVVRQYLVPQLTPVEVNGYSAVRTIGLAMIFLVAALTSVMYPKLARSFQRSEQTDVLRLTLLLTGAIGVGGALVATAFPELPLRLLSPSALWGSKVLVPAFCWAMVPLSLASVLVYNLVARECYRSVPWLAAVAAAYWLALERVHGSLLTVITVMGVFGLILLAVCAVFVRWDSGRRAG